MSNEQILASQTRVDTLATNKLIRNTYSLLSMTLLFSALTAAVSVFLRMPPIVSLISLGGSMIMIWFVLPRVANSGKGLAVVFAITGLMGFGLGPTLSYYLSMPSGPSLVATALGGTGVIFLGLSGYALVSRRDFSFMGGFLIVGLLVAIVAMFANLFLAIPALSLALSAAIIMIMSGFILYDTSRMVNGGETNYVMATVGLYLNIFNIFVNLLHLLGFANDD